MRRLPAAVTRLPRKVRVAAALEKLGARDRQVLSLILLERLTPLEAAGALRLDVRRVEHVLAYSMDFVGRDSGLVNERRAA